MGNESRDFLYRCHFKIRKAKDSKSHALKNRVTLSVALLANVVCRAIDLHDETSLRTVEIDNETIDHVLAPEFDSQTSCFEFRPKPLLVFSQGSSHLLSTTA